MSTTYTTYLNLAKPSFDTRTWHDLLNGNFDIIDNAVIGPASAVNGNVAIFDGTTGKKVKDGGTLGSAAFVDTTTLATHAEVAAKVAKVGDTLSGDLVMGHYRVTQCASLIQSIVGAQSVDTTFSDEYLTTDTVDVTWTLPSTGYVGQRFVVYQGNTGTITFQAGVSATVEFSADVTHTRTAHQGAVVTVKCVSSGRWIVSGSTAV